MRRHLILAGLCLAIAGAACAQQVSGVALPDTPAGLLLQAWLRAVNSGDTALVRDYARRYEAENPADTTQVNDVMAQILGLGQRSRGVTLAAIVDQQPDRITAALQTGDGRRLRLRYAVERVADGSYNTAMVGASARRRGIG